MEFVPLNPAHSDVVNDIAFDFYGKRFATCGNDKEIKIWDLLPETDVVTSSRWQEYSISRAHSESIWRISWAHPEFGQLLASCSQDKHVHIYEEQEVVTTAARETRERWMRKTQLSDSKGAVHDVKFAPRHLGLKLAAGSADGFVRIYEATDVFALNYWPLQDAIPAEVTAEGSPESDCGVTCLSWNDCAFEHPKLVIGGHSRAAVVWTCGSSGKWFEECRLEGHTGPVHDVAWAPGMGRSYHLIASADRSHTVRVFTLKRDPTGTGSLQDVKEIKVSAPVWRIAWNATGTILATSSENGNIDLWRKDFEGEWVIVQSTPSDGPFAYNVYRS